MAGKSSPASSSIPDTAATIQRASRGGLAPAANRRSVSESTSRQNSVPSSGDDDPEPWSATTVQALGQLALPLVGQ